MPHHTNQPTQNELWCGHLEKVKQSFNRAAVTYDAYSNLQSQVGTQLITLLTANLPSLPHTIIDLGCGSGIQTAKLAQQCQYSRFDAIDISARLLAQAKPRLTPLSVTCYEADFNQSLPGRFDIMFANLSLHWSMDLVFTIKRLASALTSRGMLCFSIPIIGTLRELTPRFNHHQFCDPTTLTQWLVELGFAIEHYQEKKIVATFDTLLAALATIKKTGTSYMPPQQLHTKPAIKKSLLLQSTTLTYHIAYWFARKTT